MLEVVPKAYNYAKYINAIWWNSIISIFQRHTNAYKRAAFFYKLNNSFYRSIINFENIIFTFIWNEGKKRESG